MTYYHGQIEFWGGYHYFFNSTKEEIIEQLLIPFVNGHVIIINSGGIKKVLNLKSVSRLAVYKTKLELTDSFSKTIIEQIEDPQFEENACTEEIINEAKILSFTDSSSSLLQKSLKEPKNQVFVISKFGDKIIDSAYEGVIKPVFEKYKIGVVRVDEIQDSGKIDDQILSNIAESKYVLADLSGSRPNCYYETGFAHALGKTIILTIRKDESIHFDLAGYRFIQWETESELREELSKRIKHLEDNR